MIEYGIALLVVCALSVLDKKAMPYALTLSVGWLAGFAGAAFWPAISFGICSATLLLYRREPTWWGQAVHLLAVAMLLADVLYWACVVQGAYIGVEYAYALNVGLALQLLLVGHQGAINGWIGLRDLCRRGLRHRSLRGMRHAEEA